MRKTVSVTIVGAPVIAVEPGGMDEIIPNGGEIKLTQSAVNLESLLGKVIYNAGGGGRLYRSNRKLASVPLCTGRENGRHRNRRLST